VVRLRRRQRSRRALDRAARLRKALGLDPFPAPLPVVAPPWSRRRWYERVAEVQRLEAAVYPRSDEAMLELERLALLTDV
jgi:hypothetical protein